MRARKRSKKSLPEWLNSGEDFDKLFDTSFRLGIGDFNLDSLLSQNTREVGEREYEGPMIVGYTHTAWGNPIPGGKERWDRMTPEERFWASDLGKAYEFSTQYGPDERRDPGAYARKIAGQDNYWGGLARNVMKGGAMPHARLGDAGSSGVEGEPTEEMNAALEDPTMRRLAANRAGDPLAFRDYIGQRFGFDAENPRYRDVVANLMDWIGSRAGGR